MTLTVTFNENPLTKIKNFLGYIYIRLKSLFTTIFRAD